MTRLIVHRSLVVILAMVLALSLAALATPKVSVQAASSGDPVYAWGNNAQGQLGNGTTSTTATSYPVQVEGFNGVGELSGATAIAAGRLHSLALMPGGAVYTWGYNSDGQLGNGGTTESPYPVQVEGLNGVGELSGATAIAGGMYHSLALMPGGAVYAWGRNGNGQLGNGTTSTTANSYPVQVEGLNGVGELSGATAVAAGTDDALALMPGGAVYAWGYNSAGQLGNGGTSDSPYPVQVEGLNGVGELSLATAIAAGEYHSLALMPGGAVYAWGYNQYGQLGNGTTTGSPYPVQVKGVGGGPPLSNVIAIAAGYDHSLALTSDGTVYAWGANGSGQLGNGGNTESPYPVQVSMPTLPSGVTVIAIAAGYEDALALTSDGAVYAWGYNNVGQLGNGGTTNSPSPVQVEGLNGVGALSGVTAIAARYDHPLALLPAPTIAVGAQSGTITAGTAGSATFAATTTNIPDTTAVTVTWYTDSSGVTPLGSPPTGLSAASGIEVETNAATITINADTTAVAGSYYFKATSDAVSSNVATVTVSAPAPTIAVGAQSGTITAGTAGSATFAATTTNIPDTTAVTVTWYTDSSGVTPLGSPPTGLSAASGIEVETNAATITINADTTAVAGSYYFKATSDAMSSNVATVTVSAPTPTIAVGAQTGTITAGLPGRQHLQQQPPIFPILRQSQSPGTLIRVE